MQKIFEYPIAFALFVVITITFTVNGFFNEPFVKSIWIGVTAGCIAGLGLFFVCLKIEEIKKTR